MIVVELGEGCPVNPRMHSVWHVGRANTCDAKTLVIKRVIACLEFLIRLQ